VRPPGPVGPRVGVGGIAVLEGRVVLIRRGKPPFEGRWSIPGGTVEWGETLEQALAREMMEETALRVQPRKLLTLFDRILKVADEVTYHYVIADYWCEVLSGTPVAGSDAREVALVAEDALPRYDLLPDALEVVQLGLMCWRESSSASSARGSARRREEES
jgi:8-oxo-dGTP diphosphatase